MKAVHLNPGAQESFFEDDSRAVAYIGGLGSGKTFAGIAKGLKAAQQPVPQGTFHGPRGAIAAINYPVLRDVILPQFFEVLDGSGLWKTGEQETSFIKYEKKALLKANCGCKDRVKCKHVAEVLFRSLDQPNWMRGLELAWYFIDEGRHLDGEAWDILYGRLRQKGYHHQGWVCSTPNGFDWMWLKFHPDSKRRLDNANWWGAPTMDNAAHLPQAYIDSLMATYEGRFLRQEVYGEFVGVVEGAVFFEWDHKRHTGPYQFDPALPLYSFWDFGYGDLGVAVYAQLAYERKYPDPSDKRRWVDVPHWYILHALESTDRTSIEWARLHKEHCLTHYGELPELNICDPAGRQRNVATGKSTIEEFAASGVTMAPAPKKPIDYAIGIVNNMLAGDRVHVDETGAERFAAAMASHKWPLDGAGNKTGTKPVHDWTSHFCDAFRYGTTMLIGHRPKERQSAPKSGYQPGTIGHVVQQLMKEPEQWLGATAPEIVWQPGLVGPRRG